MVFCVLFVCDCVAVGLFARCCGSCCSLFAVCLLSVVGLSFDCYLFVDVVVVVAVVLLLAVVVLSLLFLLSLSLWLLLVLLLLLLLLLF